MNTHFLKHARFQRTILATAVGLALSQLVCAETLDEVEQLTTPESSVTVGVGNFSSIGQRFGMYRGVYDDGIVGLLDFNYVRRNDETGTWYRASGRNLGLNTRELRLEHEKQGNWRYFVDYNEISRLSPYTIVTGVQGIGSSQLTVPSTPSTNSQFTPKTERQRTSFGLTASLMDRVQVRLKLQNEDKSGERIFGRGTTGGTGGMEFLAEPIHYNTRQIDLIVDYTGDRFQLSGGYYGSFFKNDNPVLRVQGGVSGFNSGVNSTGVPFDNISLPPDNQAHQLHLAGGYQFSRYTRLNFKVAKSIALQNDDFMSVRFFNTANNGVSANTSGRTDLGGRVDTTLANLSLLSRPINKLSILGNIRYEERDDQTAIARYITTVGGTGASPTLTALSGTSATDGYNEPRSLTNWSGKLEASYALPDGYQVTGGMDYESKKRSIAGVRVVGYREQVEENSYRLELKRSMADTLSGSLAYLYSERSGTDFRNLVTLNGTTPYPAYAGATGCGQSISAANPAITRCGLLQPIYMADRERQKVRFLSDWAPIDQLSLQLMFEGSSDNYGAGRGTPDIGVRRGDAKLLSLDATFQPTDNWKFNSWLSRTESSIDQASIASPTSNASAIVWSSRQKNTVDSVGLGARGKLPKGIEFGADYIYSYDKTSYRMSKEAYAAFTSTTTPGTLPDIAYRQQTLQLFGIYPVDKRLSVRLDYILDHRNIDDWTWSNWVYTDGTRIVASPDNTVHFVGLSMRYTFQ